MWHSNCGNVCSTNRRMLSVKDRVTAMKRDLTILAERYSNLLASWGDNLCV